MKRTMKKLSALVMAFAMVMSLAVVANAVDNPGCTLTDAGETNIATVAFAYDGSLDDDGKTAFLDAVPSAGVTLTVVGAGDSDAWETATVTGTLSGGYSFGATSVPSNAIVPIKKGDTAIGTITITLPANVENGTIKIKLTGTGEGPAGGNEVTTEADAQNGTDDEHPAINGAGSYEGYVDQEVFRVALPTVQAADLAFTIDPQGLIAATATSYAAANATYEGKKFTEAGSVFFLNTNNKAKVNDEDDAPDADYSPNSDKFTVINKGATDVDVELTLTATGTALGETPTLSFVDDTDDFTDSTDKSLYIALNTQATGDEAATVTAIALDDDTYAATATATIAKTADVYEYKYDATKYADNNGYGYELKSDADGFKQLEFWLTGAANTNATGDWGLESGSIALALTWKVTKVSAESAAAGPAVTTTPVAALSRNLEITLNATNVTGYELETVTYGDNDTEVSATMTEPDDDGAATITFTCDRTMAGSGATAVKVTFSKDGDNIDPISVTIVSSS